MPNAFSSQFEHELNGVGILSVVDAAAGAELLGATVYELAPGARWADLHVHYANEEALVVLAGTPTLHTLEGSRELETGEVVTFPRGRRGAHRIENHGVEPARVLIVSTTQMPELVEYPERGTVFVMTEPPYGPGIHDPSEHGRVLRVFERDGGRAVPPDPGAS
jgi:uncharacterized cupin superfamily protein